jgi:hypothetical protein
LNFVFTVNITLNCFCCWKAEPLQLISSKQHFRIEWLCLDVALYPVNIVILPLLPNKETVVAMTYRHKYCRLHVSHSSKIIQPTHCIYCLQCSDWSVCEYGQENSIGFIRSWGSVSLCDMYSGPHNSSTEMLKKAIHLSCEAPKHFD